MKRFPLFIVVILACFHCSGQKHYAMPGGMPYRVKVTTIHNEIFSGKFVEFNRSAMTIAMFDGGRADTVINVIDIKKLVFRRDGLALRLGLQFMGAAATAGAIVGYSIKDDQPADVISKPAAANALLWGGISAGAGFITGLLTGTIASHRFTIDGKIDKFNDMREKMTQKMNN